MLPTSGSMIFSINDSTVTCRFLVWVWLELHIDSCVWRNHYTLICIQGYPEIRKNNVIQDKQDIHAIMSGVPRRPWKPWCSKKVGHLRNSGMLGNSEKKNMLSRETFENFWGAEESWKKHDIRKKRFIWELRGYPDIWNVHVTRERPDIQKIRRAHSTSSARFTALQTEIFVISCSQHYKPRYS